MLEINEVNLDSYGKCLRISNGKIEACVTLDFGPRICRLAFVGGFNFMKEDNDFTMKTDLGKDCEFPGKTFYNRGGHRFWISPEAMPRTYYPDNEPVEYELVPGGALFTPPAQKVNDFELSLQVIMDESENKISVKHIVRNSGYWPKEFAPWSITVVAQGGTEIIPTDTRNTGLLPNRLLMLWPYTKVNDKRFSMTDKYITVKQDTSVDGAFKIGIAQEHPWAAYFLNGSMFVKTYNPVPGGVYPDNGCTYETYTSPGFLEMETLGEHKNVLPGETVTHTETWYLYENVKEPVGDVEIDELAKKYNLK